MVDLARWLGECLDEDERIARGATAGPWWADSSIHTEAIYGSGNTAVVAGGRWGDEASVFESDADAAHIVAWDPARVLREIDAKRQLLALHEPGETEYVDGDVCMVCEDPDVGDEGPFYPCKTLRLLALPYAGRPGFREEWAP